MHRVDANKTYGEKAYWKLNNGSACCFELILEATPKKKHLLDLPYPSSQAIQVRQNTAGEIRTNTEAMFSVGFMHIDVFVFPE